MVSKHVILVISLFFVYLLQCSNNPEGTHASKRIFAKIGSHKVMQKDLDKTFSYISKVDPYSKNQYEGEKGRSKLLDRHIKDEITYKDALRLGMGRAKDIVDEIQLYKRFQLLKKYNSDIIQSRAGITAKEYKNYYSKHKDEFKIKAQVLAKHILTETLEKAQEVKREIKSGKQFETLVPTYSIDKHSNTTKGVIGWVTEGGTIPYIGDEPDINQKLFHMHQGDISEPIKTRNGYHIFKIDQFKAGNYKPMNEVIVEIRDNLLTEEKYLKDYFEKHKNEHQEEEKRKIRHILLANEKQATSIHSMLKRGTDFEELVTRFSTCPGTKDKGGDLGYVKKNSYIVNVGKELAFDNTVFAFKQALDISGVVKTQRGYHIVQLVEIQAPRLKTFDEVKDIIKTKVLTERKQQSIENASKRLEQKYKIKIMPESSSDKNKIYAKIGSYKVTDKDLDKSLNYLSKVDPYSMQEYEQGDSARIKLLKRHIKDEITYKDALRRGMGREQEIVDELELYKRYLLLRKYNNEVIEGRAGIPQKELKDYYKNNREQFKIKAQLLAKHILTPTLDSAQLVIKELKAGKDFDVLVSNYSVDKQTNTTKGVIGWITEGGGLPFFGKNLELGQKLFSMQQGEISDPFKTDRGYHVFKIQKYKKAKYKDMKDVRVDIRDKLLTKEEYLKNYYEKHKNEYMDKERRKVRHILLAKGKQAKKIHGLLTKGSDFEKLVPRHSICMGTKDKGGNLGFVKRNSYVVNVGKELGFENAVFALSKLNDITDVVQTKRGYHIVQLLEIQASRQKPFSEVKELFKSKVLAERKLVSIENAYKRLEKKYTVKRLPEPAKSVKEYFDLAQKALEEKKYTGAISNYEDVIKHHKKSDKIYQAYFLVGWVYSEYLKDYAKADEYFKIVLDKYPKSDLADDAKWMIANQRNPNALDFIKEKTTPPAKTNI